MSDEPTQTSQTTDASQPVEAGGQASVASTIAPPIGGGRASDTPDFRTFVPDDLRDREYIKSILNKENPAQELFTQFDNLQRKLGERPKIGIPDETATEEDRQAFYKALGVPESPDAYEMPKIEWSEDEKYLGEYYDSVFEGEFKDEIFKMMHNLKIPKSSAEKLVTEYQKLGAKHFGQAIQEAQIQTQTYTQDFDKLVDKHYGANKDQYFDTAKKAIKEYVDPELQPILGNYEEIPNDLLVAVSSAMNNMYKAIKEEDGAPSNRQSTTAENSKEYWQNLILERNKLDPFNPKYDELQAKITEYFARTSR